MKTFFRSWVTNARDIIALVIVCSYCLAFLITVCVPGIVFNELMGRQYERIMILVVGYFFGSSHANQNKRSTDGELPPKRDP